MQKTVPFQDRMEARHSDFNFVQTAVRHSIDQLTADAVTRVAPGYAGFTVTQNGGTELAIAAGRVYRTDGAMFEAASAQTRSIVSILPSATQRIVAVVVYGQEEDSRSETRDFLVDLESDQTQPRTVVVERRRAAILDLVPGQESATLPRPTINSSLMVIAWVTIGTGGIQSIVMEQSTRLSSVSLNDSRIKSLETWRGVIEPRINTIASDITALKNGLNNRANQDEMVAAMRDIARLKERLEIPDTASDWAADRFLTNDETDVTNIDLLALLEEGVRFPNDGQSEVQIGLYNPLDSNAYITGSGLILPAISGLAKRLASSAGAEDGSIFIAQYGFQTHEMKQLSIARERTRYGPAYQVCNNNQWWREGSYDSATNTFERDGETFNVVGGEYAQQSPGVERWSPNVDHSYVRIQQFWVDTWKEVYWVAQTTDRTVSGAQIAQTFLNSQDGWLAQLNLRVTDKGPDGDLHVSICEVGEDGAPLPKRLVAHITVPHASLKVSPIETTISFAPTFLEAGKRYAILLTTLGSHKVAIVDSNEYSQGTLFFSTDGAYFAGDLTRDLFFELRFLQFRSSRVEIEIGALTLSGGIADIDIMAPTIKPGSTSVTYQVLINGAWKSLDQVTPNLLIGLPPLLRCRMVMTGTTAVAPGVQMQGSRIRIWRQRTNFKHISTRRTLATTASTILVDLILGRFDSARHTITVRLKKDDNSYVTSTGFVDTRIDPERISRRFSFSPIPTISAYKIEIVGTTNNALVPFHVEERVDIAL